MKYSKNRIKELEELDKLRGAQGNYQKAMDQKQAMQEGVVGSGQMSSEEFMEKRNPGMSTMQKVAAGKMLLEGVTGQSVGQMTGAGEGVSGAASGAMAGAQFGPKGAIIGGVVGALQGAAQARAARKARNAQIEAKKEAALGQIGQREKEKEADILGQLGARMSAALR